MKENKVGFLSVGMTGGFDQKVAARNFKEAAAAIKALGKKSGFTPVMTDDYFSERPALSAFLETCLDERVSLIILHTSCFTAGGLGQEAASFVLEHPLPFVIWGVPEPTGGPLTVNNLCCANFMCSIFFSMGVPYKWLWGAPGNADVERGLTDSVIAAKSIRALRGASLYVVGAGRVPGFYGSGYNESEIKSRFGTNIELTPLSDFYRRFTSVTPAQERAAMQKIGKLGARCSECDDDLKLSARAYAALKQFADETGALGLALRCWPEIRDDLGTELCLPMAMLGDEGLPCSCEGDVPGLLSMLLQRELAGPQAGPPSLLDMVSIDKKHGSVGLWHCGVISPSLAQAGSMCICKHLIVEENNPRAKMGLLLESVMKPGPATVLRFQGISADRLLAVDGDIIKKKPDFRGSYGEFRPEGMSGADLANTAMAQGLTHHFSIAYTRHAALAREAAYWLGVHPIDTVPADSQDANFGRI